MKCLFINYLESSHSQPCLSLLVLESKRKKKSIPCLYLRVRGEKHFQYWACVLCENKLCISGWMLPWAFCMALRVLFCQGGHRYTTGGYQEAKEKKVGLDKTTKLIQTELCMGPPLHPTLHQHVAFKIQGCIRKCLHTNLLLVPCRLYR